MFITTGNECADDESSHHPEWKRDDPVIYHRLPICCIRAGDTDGGGLDIVRPFAGLMIGIALRARVAAGACNFKAA